MNGLEQRWYRITPLHLLLFPLSLLFGALAALRRMAYRTGLFSSQALPVPVIVVGNITVGGTGKTPFTLWLAQRLLEAGRHPGIISRGYGSRHHLPRPVGPDDLADEVGDEPLLMAQRGVCPVWVGRSRIATGQALLRMHPECDIILSDDGLQHYALQRDVEIVLVDGARRFGNGLLLPAGPLREPVSRLHTVDFVVANGGLARSGEWPMQLHADDFYNLLNPDLRATAQSFVGRRIHAIAGIGHPERFFAQLRLLGLDIVSHPFPDHHAYRATDLSFGDADVVLMTEKDAVKCAAFASEHCWVLRVDAALGDDFLQQLLGKLPA